MGPFRHALFQVASLLTTTGFTTTDYNMWPMLAKTTLVLLMFTGAMAGSTAGGMKVSRIVIAIKGSYINVRKLINPRYVPKTKMEGKTLEQKTINDVFAFITLYFFILLGVIFLLSFDPINGQLVNNGIMLISDEYAPATLYGPGNTSQYMAKLTVTFAAAAPTAPASIFTQEAEYGELTGSAYFMPGQTVFAGW